MKMKNYKSKVCLLALICLPLFYVLFVFLLKETVEHTMQEKCDFTCRPCKDVLLPCEPLFCDWSVTNNSSFLRTSISLYKKLPCCQECYPRIEQRFYVYSSLTNFVVNNPVSPGSDTVDSLLSYFLFKDKIGFFNFHSSIDFSMCSSGNYHIKPEIFIMWSKNKSCLIRELEPFPVKVNPPVHSSDIKILHFFDSGDLDKSLCYDLTADLLCENSKMNSAQLDLIMPLMRDPICESVYLDYFRYNIFKGLLGRDVHIQLDDYQIINNVRCMKEDFPFLERCYFRIGLVLFRTILSETKLSDYEKCLLIVCLNPENKMVLDDVYDFSLHRLKKSAYTLIQNAGKVDRELATMLLSVIRAGTSN